MRGTLPRNKFPPKLAAIVNPGAGNPFNITPPAGRAWRILGIRCLFTSSAVAVGRGPYCALYDGSVEGAISFDATIITASLAIVIHFNGAFRGTPYSQFGHHAIPLDNEIIITPTLYFRVNALNIDAGDTFTGIYIVHEDFILE